MVKKIKGKVPPKKKGATHKRTWKKSESRIAAKFGTTRTPLSGGASGHTRSDTLHKRLFIEAKLRNTYSVVTLWDDTTELANLEDKTPVVILSEKGRPGFWVLTHIDDLATVAGELVDDEPTNSKLLD